MAPLLNSLEYIAEQTKKFSARFKSPQMELERKHLRLSGFASIAVLLCMDGRLNFEKIVHLPLGFLSRLWRTAGGIFDLDDPIFSSALERWVDEAIPTNGLIFVTYHFSDSDPDGRLHKGCAGHNYSTAAAIDNAKSLYEQIRGLFGGITIYPVLCGIDTDSDKLILHGESGKVLPTSSVPNCDAVTLNDVVLDLFPSLPMEARSTMFRILKGNCEHIAEVRAEGREPIDLSHREFILAVGRGFEWLDETNRAIDVSYYDPRFGQSLVLGANLLLNNMRTPGVASGAPPILLAGAQFEELGYKRELAIRRARRQMKQAIGIIDASVPALMSELKCVTGVLNLETRLMEFLD